MVEQPGAEPVDPLGRVILHRVSRDILVAAVELGIPESLDEQAPTAVDDLADRVGAEPAALRRLLRALVVLGVLTAEGERFGHTPASRLLASMRGTGALGSLLSHGWMEPLWQRLAEGVRTGRPQFPELMGKPFYDYLSEDDPAAAVTFHTVLTRGLGLANPAVAEALAPAGDCWLVDVGGGEGGLLCEALRRHPSLRGTLLDVESVVGSALPELRSGELASRAEVIGGDAQESVPAGADIYLMRMVLHNWDDDACVRMLRNCAAVGRPGARVVAVEIPMPEDGTVSEGAAIMDLQMFMLFGTQERTASEYAELFRRAGLVPLGSRPTGSAFHLIEARVPG